LEQKPLLVHALVRLHAMRFIEWVAVAVRAEDIDRVAEWCHRYRLHKVLPPVKGGAVRLASVHAALQVLPKEADLVLVHDAARPCVSAAVVERVIEAATHTGAAACGVAVPMTVKAVSTAGWVQQTLKREALRLIQTPQVIRRDWLQQAFARVDRRRWASLPDDCALVEQAGRRVRIVPGDPYNIKVTTQEDLLFARQILRIQARTACTV
jgi:2-C-methyl-D-erythritol 4-phosphate cytidylyltransferase